MKKLTAGILASLIGLVSANSAEAAVASTSYVDGAIGTKQDTLTPTNFIAPAETGDFISGFEVNNGTVTFTSGKLPAAAVVDATLDQASTNAIQNQAVAKKIAEMASSTVEANKVVKSVTQVEGKITPTYAQVTGADIEDGTIADADIASVTMAKVTGLDTALAGKQDTLTPTNFKVGAGQTGDYVTGFTVNNGVVEFTKGTPQQAPVDDALSETSPNAVQNKVITSTIYGMDYTATDTTGVVQNVTQADGKVSATFGKVATEDIADGAVTTTQIADNAVTSAKIADGTIDNADIANVDMSKVTGLGAALDAKQAKLTAGDFINIDQTTGEITTTYSAGTGIKIGTDGAISADNQLNNVTGTGDTGLQVLTRNCNDQGVCSYVWEDIDRTFTAQ